LVSSFAFALPLSKLTFHAFAGFPAFDDDDQ
jgi:hypothetical protein